MIPERDLEFVLKISDYASKQMKSNPSVSECAALEILCSISVWLSQWYEYCENPENKEKPTMHISLKNVHNLI